jgi:hypothetical protein
MNAEIQIDRVALYWITLFEDVFGGYNCLFSGAEVSKLIRATRLYYFPDDSFAPPKRSLEPDWVKLLAAGKLDDGQIEATVAEWHGTEAV